MSADSVDLTGLAPELRALVSAALPEVARSLTPEQTRAWLEGARRLAEAGAGLASLVTYLRVVPAVAKQGGDAALPRIIATALTVAAQARGYAVDAFLSALPIAARRLYTPDSLTAFLDVVDEFAALAPDALAH